LRNETVFDSDSVLDFIIVIKASREKRQRYQS
jgi:hypothetical protein